MKWRLMDWLRSFSNRTYHLILVAILFFYAIWIFSDGFDFPEVMFFGLICILSGVALLPGLSKKDVGIPIVLIVLGTIILVCGGYLVSTKDASSKLLNPDKSIIVFAGPSLKTDCNDKLKKLTIDL